MNRSLGVAVLSALVGAVQQAQPQLRPRGVIIEDYTLPGDGLPGALREAAAVVHLQVVETLGTRPRSDHSIATEHRAKVLAVVKADRPEIAAGREIAFDQPGAGEWFEGGGRVAVGIETPYVAGVSFIAFLRREPDSRLAEFAGPAYMWPAKQGFVMFPDAAGTVPAGLRSPMPVEDCLAALRKFVEEQKQSGSVAGRVTDSSGGALPGVTLTLSGAEERKQVTNSRGEFRFEDLPRGRYRAEAVLPGFRRAVADQVVVDAGRATRLDLALRLGIVTTHGLYVMVPLPEALRQSHVVVHLRTTAARGSRLLGAEQNWLVTLHEATILGVVKTDNARLTVGSSMQFAQLAAGIWVEDGLQYVGADAPYSPGQAFVALLGRGADGELVELGRPWMFPVSANGRVTIKELHATEALPVEEAVIALRKLLAR